MSTISRQLRALLLLGRISNLPTVWSNCLAGWLLNGGEAWFNFYLLCAAATLLYAGGMYLNDAFDVEFDRQHRPERPISSGQIALSTVWSVGVVWLALGWVLLLPLGVRIAMIGLLLVATIVTYDAFHKRMKLAPLLMAACRFLLYVVAGAATQRPIANTAFWHGLALAAYVTGLSFLARGESTPANTVRWPLALLVAPVVANVILNPNGATAGWIATAALVAWIAWCLRGSLRSVAGGTGKTVAGLLAGIVIVDWSAVAPPLDGPGIAFIGLFLLALVLQRTVPAT